MKFSIKEIKERVDSTLFSHNGLLEMIDWIDENHATHNHYKLSADFVRTDLFKDVLDGVNLDSLSKVDKREVQEQVRDELVKIMVQVEKLDPSELTYEVLEPILPLFAKHIIGNKYEVHNIFRFNSNPFLTPDRIFNHIETALTQCNQINEVKNDPENGGLAFNTWNREMMGAIWACVYAGLIDEGLYLVETLENLIYRINENEPKNCVFKTVLDQPTLGRFLMTLYMAKARLYLQTGDNKKAEECFEFIASMFRKEGPKRKQYYIYWFTGLNRVLEAAIEVYKLNPTPENKQRCFDYYIQSAEFAPGIEPTETTREKGIITYMFIKHVLGIKIK